MSTIAWIGLIVVSVCTATALVMVCGYIIYLINSMHTKGEEKWKD